MDADEEEGLGSVNDCRGEACVIATYQPVLFFSDPILFQDDQFAL